MEALFAVFLGVVLAGCLLTDGAVMGAAMHVFWTDHRRVATAIGPLFLATEVWFVALIGLVAGGFPSMEASLLTTAYPVLALFLFSWIARDAALWFGPRIVSDRWQGFWGTVLGVASTVMAAALGASIGVALAGGAAAGHDAAFELARLGAPPVWIGAIVLPVILAWHGRSFLRWRGGIGEPGESAGALVWLSSAVVLAITVAVVLVGAGTIMSSLTQARSAAVLAAIAVPVFAVMLIVQGVWWWIAGRTVTEFFAWRRRERPVPSVPAPPPAPAGPAPSPLAE